MTQMVKILTALILLFMASCTTTPVYHLERAELFSGKELIGQPYSSKQTNIRMVRVCTVQEADSFFVALCRNMGYDHVFTCRRNGMMLQYCRNEQTDGEMIYTHEVPFGTYEVGVIYIMDFVINSKGIREVHFVETIKTNKQ